MIWLAGAGMLVWLGSIAWLTITLSRLARGGSDADELADVEYRAQRLWRAANRAPLVATPGEVTVYRELAQAAIDLDGRWLGDSIEEVIADAEAALRQP